MIKQELTIDEVHAILTTHAAEWAEKPLTQLASTGTDNALYMLGNDCVLRIPKRESAIKLLQKELIWLPKLGGLPLRVPEIIFHGKATQTVGFDFGIYKWEQGQIAAPDRITNGAQSAKTLAQFLAALHQKDTDGAPKAGSNNCNRGVELARLSKPILASIDFLADEIDATSARELWELGCSAPAAPKRVWVHGDLKADNMIACKGALTAVIDWGLSAVGDPAVDYAAAWTCVAPENREVFQYECDIAESDWLRAKSWALYGAVIALSFYRGRLHEALCEQSRTTLRRLNLC